MFLASRGRNWADYGNGRDSGKSRKSIFNVLFTMILENMFCSMEEREGFSS